MLAKICMLNCNFMCETVASPGLSSFIDSSYVRWILDAQVFIIDEFVEGRHEL